MPKPKKPEYKPEKEEVKIASKKKEDYIPDYITGQLVRETPEEMEARQVFERRLVEEYGYSKKQIKPNFLIQKGSQRIGPADIVVFHDERKAFDNIKIIVETKRKNRTDGIDQLKSYSISSSQEFAVWFNGKEAAYYQTLDKPPYFREIPDIPKKGESLDEVGLYYKKDLRPAIELKSIFEDCHNYIYANEGFLKEKVFNEVLKMIFIKMADEKTPNPKCEFRVTDKEFKELEEGKENAFMGRITKLFNRVKAEYVDVFDDPNERINVKSLTCAYVVSRLQKFSLLTTPADVKGTAFQVFVYAHQRGERGEFFTPYPIVELAVKMLDPKDDELFIDPACGSGSFLVRGMNWVKEKFKRNRPELPDSRVQAYVKDYAHTYIKGIDINPDLARVAKMYMILYDDGHTGIFSTNALESPGQIKEAAKEARAGGISFDSFQVLMTNPPFGTKGKVTDKRNLEHFDLGYKWKKTGDRWEKTDKLMDGQVPDILFIERCLQLLAESGRMAIVLPDGDLTNTSLGYVRQFIKDHARILAVISLPQETFIPHGAGVKASVLFLQKFPEKELEHLKKQNYPIFMAVCEKIGYDIRGRKVSKRNERGEMVNEEGEVVYDKKDAATDEDITEIIKKFEEFKKKNKLGF